MTFEFPSVYSIGAFVEMHKKTLTAWGLILFGYFVVLTQAMCLMSTSRVIAALFFFTICGIAIVQTIDAVTRETDNG